MFEMLQNAREELMRMGTEKPDECRTPESKQDVLLSNMVDKAKDAIKNDFANIIAMKYPHGPKIT